MDPPIALPKPSPDETTMALLAQVLQIFTWWIGPLVIFLVKRESKFACFHAMQALLWQCAMIVLGIAGGALWMMCFFLFAFSQMGKPHGSAPPPFFFVLFPLLWLGIMGCWALNVVIGIVFGVKAGRGEWAQYPLLGWPGESLEFDSPAERWPAGIVEGRVFRSLSLRASSHT